MKRWIVGAVVVVVLAAGAGTWFLSTNLDEIVRSAIESQGSAALGTTVRVGSVELDLREGRGRLRDLRIANPPGSGAGNQLELGSVTLGIDASSALDVVRGSSRHFIIDTVAVEEPLARVIVGADGSTNVQALQKAMSHGSSAEASAETSGDPLLLTLKQVSMARGEVRVDTSGLGGKERNLTLPDFSLRNVGGGGGKPAGEVGVTIATGFAKRLTTVLVADAAESQLDRVIDKHLGGESGKAAKGLLKQVLGGG